MPSINGVNRDLAIESTDYKIISEHKQKPSRQKRKGRMLKKVFSRSTTIPNTQIIIKTP